MVLKRPLVIEVLRGMAVESDFSVSSAETGVAATLGVEIVRASAGTMPSGTATAVASSIWVTFG